MATMFVRDLTYRIRVGAQGQRVSSFRALATRQPRRHVSSQQQQQPDPKPTTATADNDDTNNSTNRTTPFRLPRPKSSRLRASNSYLNNAAFGGNFQNPGVLQPPPPNNTRRLADHLKAAGERVAPSEWVRVEGIPPLSSLDAMMWGVEAALRQERDERGIVDLDAVWNPDREDLPFLELGNDISKWLTKAYLILSPFARPSGWHLQFKNRSIAHALLQHKQPVKCAWKPVYLKPYKPSSQNKNNNNNKDQNTVAEPVLHDVSNATLRVEGCPHDIDHMHLLHLFSRYDLRQAGGPSIVKWRPPPVITHNLAVPFNPAAIPTTFLVHFHDAAWARAALREQQGHLYRHDKFELRLAPYPQQLI